jgi:phenylpyruvate tautomerase PptA (4-oxalocrotonate tautomerase family)
MPFIRVTCPANAFTAGQKEKLASSLAHAVMAQILESVSEDGLAATPVVFDEIDEHDCFPGGQPLARVPDRTFWIVEAMVSAAFFDQERRDALQAGVARAFVGVLGDDGSVAELDGLRVSPAYLLRLYTVIVEVPEGSWGAGGGTVGIAEIGRLIGAGGSARLAEAQRNADRLKAARIP